MLRPTSAALLLTVLAAGCASAGAGAGVANQCDARYGNPPRARERSLASASVGIADMLGACAARGGRLLRWRDPEGHRRRACLFVPPGAGREHPLPLLVFLHGSVFAAEPQAWVAGLEERAATADLTGDPARPGFILLVPDGRDTGHYYPFPDDTGFGWDNWYRNLDRRDPRLNLDVAAVDHFVAEVKRQGLVDEARVYLSGWSNGSALAILYALNTPGVAAAAVYSAPDPFEDFDDPCPQAPFGNNPAPLMYVHNACDTLGICDSGRRLQADLARAFPGLEVRQVILDPDQREVASCEAACARGTLASYALGTHHHLHWPDHWTDAMLRFLREHPRAAPQALPRAESPGQSSRQAR